MKELEEQRRILLDETKPSMPFKLKYHFQLWVIEKAIKILNQQANE